MISERVETKILNRKTMKELIEKLQEATHTMERVKTEDWNVNLTKTEVIFLLESLQSKGKTSAEQFLRDKYKLVDFHDLTLNGKPWVELMEEYGQSHADQDGCKVVPWQCCPICNGSGQMYEPLSTGTFRPCPTCNGQRIIPMQLIYPQP